ncbi:MAG: tetratricopeptide repeat protein [Anaerolineae bacterium]|nr:tetratricopeptide repeat protein [Anaerolineae bacterium]
MKKRSNYSVFSKRPTWVIAVLLLIVAVLVITQLSGSETPPDVSIFSSSPISPLTLNSPPAGISSPTVPPDPYVEAYRQATIFFEAGEYEKAIASYSEAISVKPDSASAHNDRGNAYTQLEMYEKARADYNRAIELNPALPEPYYNLGWIETILGDYEEALVHYQTASEISPLVAYDAIVNRCGVYYKMGDFEQAIAECTVGIEQNPANHRAYNSRALAYLALENYQAAVADYEQSVTLIADNEEAYWGLGWANYNLGNYQEAIEATQKAIDLNSGDPRLHFNLGLYRLAAGRLTEATASYQTGLSLIDSLDPQTAEEIADTSVQDLEELKEQKPNLADEIETVIGLFPKSN